MYDEHGFLRLIPFLSICMTSVRPSRPTSYNYPDTPGRVRQSYYHLPSLLGRTTRLKTKNTINKLYLRFVCETTAEPVIIINSPGTQYTLVAAICWPVIKTFRPRAADPQRENEWIYDVRTPRFIYYMMYYNIIYSVLLL